MWTNTQEKLGAALSLAPTLHTSYALESHGCIHKLVNYDDAKVNNFVPAFFPDKTPPLRLVGSAKNGEVDGRRVRSVHDPIS